MFTRALRADGKGRHTTVHRELVVLPGGGLVVDTPGLRSVGLTDVSESLDLVFADVEELAEQCRFGDCAHESEPGCAVRAALESGELPERRWESYRQAAARGPLDGDAPRRPAARRGALEVEADHQGVPQPAGPHPALTRQHARSAQRAGVVPVQDRRGVALPAEHRHRRGRQREVRAVG